MIYIPTCVMQTLDSCSLLHAAEAHLLRSRKLTMHMVLKVHITAIKHHLHVDTWCTNAQKLVLILIHV